MPTGSSLINLGELSKPATVLIEKVSDAIGVVYEPTRIRRRAKAEADAERTRALVNIEISEHQELALQRMIQEEGKRQTNIQSITAQAAEQVREDAKPDELEDDWISNLFEKCRNISDADMQTLWSKILAGEANKPGSFSKKTVNLLPNLSKSDAVLFTNFCSYVWSMPDLVPLVFDSEHEIYNKGSRFADLMQLQDLGLVTYSFPGFKRTPQSRKMFAAYYGKAFILDLENEPNNELEIGYVLLTSAGKELATICGSARSDEYLSYVLQRWRDQNLNPVPIPLDFGKS